MKKLLVAGLSLFLGACGGDEPDFTGSWSGSFDRLENNCPFTLPQTLEGVFPLVVTAQGEDSFTVVAADGSTATGGQGDGETISFLAKAPGFGDYGSISPYSCTSETTVGFLTTGNDTADINVEIKFTNCVAPPSLSQDDHCFATYFGTGRKS